MDHRPVSQHAGMVQVDDQGSERDDLRIVCSDLAGRRQELIVFADRAGLVVVFPPMATAVLGRSQVEWLGAALIAGSDRNPVVAI